MVRADGQMGRKGLDAGPLLSRRHPESRQQGHRHRIKVTLESVEHSFSLAREPNTPNRESTPAPEPRRCRRRLGLRLRLRLRLPASEDAQEGSR